ncbi:MAG: flagellar motor switch protein FliM [Georgenia sp.]
MPSAEKAPVAYDFRRPMTLPREHARLLEMAFESFSRHWANQLVARLRVNVTGTVEKVRMRTYEEYIGSLPATTTMVLLTTEPGRRAAAIEFPLAASLVWVDHMLGGPGTQGAVPDRELTELEQELIRELLRRTLSDLNYVFASILPLGVELKSIQYNPQFVQAAEASTPVIVGHITLHVDGHDVPTTVMLPAEGIVSALRDGENTDERSETEIEEDRLLHTELAESVEHVPVEVNLRFRPITVHPREMVTLAVGDLLPLHHPSSRPLDVVVGNKTLAQAAPVAQGSRLAGMVVHVKEHS